MREHRLPTQSYMAFPFRMKAGGPEQTGRMPHIRQKIEQVLFTSPGERVFRPDWGFGARAYVFEPNRVQIWEIARNRLMAAVADALAGDIDPKTLKIEVGAPPGKPEQMLVEISYVIAALNKEERHSFVA